MHIFLFVIGAAGVIYVSLMRAMKECMQSGRMLCHSALADLKSDVFGAFLRTYKLDAWHFQHTDLT